MNVDAEHPEPESLEDDTLVRHKRFAEVLDGKRSMDWSDWAMVIDESKCLTPDGRRVALWAADTLRQTLKDNFFQRVADWLTHMRAIDPDLAPDSHPVFSLGLWPANDVPWVYANLIRLAAHLQLFNLNLPHNKFRRVRETLHQNLDPINWVSALLQLEVAGFGLRAAWDILFEPPARGNNVDAYVREGAEGSLLLSPFIVATAPSRMAVGCTNFRLPEQCCAGEC